MSNAPAVAEKNIVDRVAVRVKELVLSKDIDLPAGYSASNALKSAYLILKDAVDRNKRPVLEVCTQESVANALLGMVVLGLDPARSHCYFIPYGSKLTMTPSYLGKTMIAKRLNPHIKDITAELIFDGDELEITLHNGRKVVQNHKQRFATPTIDILTGAYAMAIGNSGEVLQTVIMTKDEIFKSWGQSRQKPFDDKGNLKKSMPHYKFAGEFFKRTAINRLCKTLISTAVPADSFLDTTIQEIEVEATEAELANAIEENAGKMEIAFPDEPVVPEPTPEPEPTQKPRRGRKKAAEPAPVQDDGFSLSPEPPVEAGEEIPDEDTPF